MESLLKYRSQSIWNCENVYPDYERDNEGHRYPNNYPASYGPKPKRPLG